MAKNENGSESDNEATEPSRKIKETIKPRKRTKKRTNPIEPHNSNNESSDAEADRNRIKPHRGPCIPTHKKDPKSLNCDQSSDDESGCPPARKRPKNNGNRRERSASSTPNASSTTKVSPARETLSEDEDIMSDNGDEHGSLREVKPCMKHLNRESCVCVECWDRLRSKTRRRRK